MDKIESTTPKIPLILFSGGLDSSYLLETMLREGNVETLYVAGAQAPDKIEKEIEARRNIIRILEKETGNQVLRDHRINLPNVLGGEQSVVEHTFLQPLIWLTGAIHVTDGYRHSELLVAYVSGDQILSQLHEISQAWTSMQAFTKRTVIPIKFPFKFVTKQNILNNISKRVVQNIWICESPTKKRHNLVACKSCLPCLTIDSQLHTWEKINGYSYSSHVLRHFYVQPPNPYIEEEKPPMEKEDVLPPS